MPAKKTTRRQEKPAARRPYIVLSIGRAQLTAPKRTARRAVRAVRSTATHVGASCLTVVVQLLARR
ncbi:hypothetical protein [Streptomyces sp. CB02115]|uniref:hypothetical protein n=1 Tax=Streptomyces sp. CB02115 TaxID=1703939 RepID=UPI000938EF43|nr:hypothetical protein [Streptomyces sp. CB02115]OKJ51662.1 hypothetical protein AMK28_24965 [Streptomyces sp. CB02115]